MNNIGGSYRRQHPWGYENFLLGLTFYSFYQFPIVLICGQAFNIQGTFEGNTLDPNNRNGVDSTL